MKINKAFLTNKNMMETTIKINERERELATTTLESMLKAIDNLKSDKAVEARYDLKLLLNKFNKTSMEITTKDCPFCGEEIKKTAKKCKHCGEMLGKKEKESTKDKTLAGLLALFLGGLGIHKFYLGKTGQGFIYLIFCWTYIPAIISLIDGILLLTMSKEKFNAKY